MSKTPIYDSEHLEEGSSNPEVPIDEMIDVVEVAANSLKSWTIIGDLVVTKAQLALGIVHELNGSPSAPFAFGVPAVGRYFVLRNNTTKTCTAYVVGQSGAGEDVSPSQTATLHSDGVNIVALGGGASEVLLDTQNVVGAFGVILAAEIPAGGYSSLRLEFVGRSDAPVVAPALDIRINGDTSFTYHFCQQQVNDGTQQANSGNDTALITGISVGAGGDPGFVAISKWTFHDFLGSNFKMCEAVAHHMSSTSAATKYTRHGFGMWLSTDPITQLELLCNNGGALTGLLKLYGIK